MSYQESVCVSNFETGETISSFQFTGWCQTYSEYFVVNLDKESEYICEEIIDDLLCDGEYSDEDIIVRVEFVCDHLKDALIGKVKNCIEEKGDFGI